LFGLVFYTYCYDRYVVSVAATRETIGFFDNLTSGKIWEFLQRGFLTSWAVALLMGVIILFCVAINIFALGCASHFYFPFRLYLL